MGVIFEHDFEDNSLAAYSSIGSVSASIDTAQFYQGIRSGRALTSAQTVKMKKSFTAGSKFGVRFAIRRSSASDESGIVFALGDNAEDAYSFCIQNLTSTLTLRVFEGGPGFTTLESGPAFNNGVWNLIDVKADSSADPWKVSWRVNSVDRGEFTYDAAGAETDINSIYWGSFGFNMSWDVHFDYIAVGDGYDYVTTEATYGGHIRRGLGVVS